MFNDLILKVISHPLVMYLINRNFKRRWRVCHINTPQRCRSVDRLSLSHLPSCHVCRGVSQPGLFCQGSCLKLCHFPLLPLLGHIQPLQALLRLLWEVRLPSKPTHLCQGCLRGLCVDKRVNGYAIISEVREKKMVV